MVCQSKKPAFLKMGGICNNRCLGCDISSGEHPFVLDTGQLKKELLRLRKKGFGGIDLIGGEITLQPNFFEILESAASVFPKVYFSTNGRIFSSKSFVRKIIKVVEDYSCKLDLEVSLHGHNARVCDSYTNAPNSFKQLLAGMENIAKYKKYFRYLGINTLVLKSNYRYLDKISDLISDFGVFQSWYLLHLIPVEGRPLNNIKLLMPRYKDLSILGNVVSKAYTHFDCIDLDGFPQCAVSKRIISSKKDKINIVNVSDTIEFDERRKVIRAFNPTYSFKKIDYISNISASLKLKELQVLQASFRTKLPVCKKCFHYTNCAGVWKEYINLFGLKSVSEEIEYLNKTNL